MVTDEYGVIQGLLTPLDILEVIAGEFPDEDEHPTIESLGPDRWRVDGATDLRYLAQALETKVLGTEGESFTSIAGMLLDRYGSLPDIGTVIDVGDLRFEIMEISNRRIATLMVTRVSNEQKPEQEA